MEQRWDELESALGSGDPDRVNEAIDEIGGLDIDERAQLFETAFDDLAGLYAERDDGYVRQATVRAAEALTPGLAAAVNLIDDVGSLEIDLEQLRDQTDALCGFFLEALTDDDGRVRQSAKRGFQDTVRTYEVLEDWETIEALIVDLDAMADEHAGRRRDHVLEARDDARFHLRTRSGH